MRLNFEFSEERINDLKALQTETGSESMKELFYNALTMLEWAVKEVKSGNEIAARSSKGVIKTRYTFAGARGEETPD